MKSQKSLFRTSFFLLISLFIFTAPLPALTITWTGNGPNNLWSNSGNWNTGTVPTGVDEVIIPNNSGMILYNHVDRQALSLLIGTGSTVRLLNGTQLRLIDPVFTALESFGTLNNRGNLIIDNATNWAIKNHGTIYNRGVIAMENLNYRGLENVGVVYNRSMGSITVLSTSDAGLVADQGTFVNEGTIRFLDGGSGLGMLVGDGFENTSTGSILFEGDNPGQFNVSDGSAENFGLISFADGASHNYPVYLTSGNNSLYNGATGQIKIEGFGAAGIALSGFTTLENDGLIAIRGDDNTYGFGITTSGVTFTNGASGRIKISTADYGISVGGSLVFDNYGTVEMTDVNRGILNYGLVENLDGGVITFEEMLSEDIHNEGTFINYYCANIFGDKQILNFVYLVNYGWISYDSPGANHVSYGLASYYLNRGVIVDPYDRFGLTNGFDNEMVRTTFLTSPQAHVPYPIALDIGSTTDLSISNFYIDENLNTSAGTYDLATNVYTPNNNAIGATTLFAEATAGTTGCTQIFPLRVIDGVQPLVNSNPHAFSAVAPGGISQAKGMTLFPNPNTGDFKIQLDATIVTPTILRLTDLHGRTVWTEEVINQNNFSIDLADQLTTGIYQLQASQNGQIISTKKVIIHPTF